MKKKLSHYIEYVAFHFVAVIVRLIPFQYIHKVGLALGNIAYHVLTSRRKVALRNLRNAFPEKSLSCLKTIAKHSFCSVTTTFLEILYYPKLTTKKMLERIKVSNTELFDKAKSKGKGCIFLTAHYGSWEFAMQVAAILYGEQGVAIAKSLSNPLLDKVIHKYRSAYKLLVVSTQQSVRESLRVLQEGGILCLAADQAASKESIAVEFFGREVPTFAGPATFCLKTGAMLIVGLAMRQKDGTYQMELRQVQTDNLIKATEENILELTKRLTKITEELIRQHPDQWMWMHKRWKHVKDRIVIEDEL